MSWAETLKINGNMKKPLDKLAYEIFYNLSVVQNKGYGTSASDVFIVEDGKDNIGTSEYSGSTCKVVILPTTITQIGAKAFQNCTNLSTVIIPEGVQVIALLAFGGCTGLKCVRLPSTINTISSTAFLGATNLEHIYVPWSEGKIAEAPWGANNATVHYNS